VFRHSVIFILAIGFENGSKSCIIRAADPAYHVLLTSLSRHFSRFPNSPKSNENYMKRIFIG